MALTDRENRLRNATFARPEWIPCTVHVSGASRKQGREELEEVLSRHPTLFPGFRKGQRDFDTMEFGPVQRAGERFTDAWGCVWRCEIDGITGIVEKHPLARWEDFETYEPPDPLVQGDRGPVDWDATRRRIEAIRRRGGFTAGGVPHGFLFMRLYYLRGFENLMEDFADERPELQRLIDMLVAHNRVIIDQWLQMKVDMVRFGDDLGTQNASMISPSTFHRWVAPAHRALMQPCRESGALVFLHSDGHVLELMDEFIEAGVDIINPQDLCNGIDNLAREVKGRMCICLDVDRQTVVPYGTRKEIHDLIEEAVRKLGAPEGGLELMAGIYPPTPPENVDALCEAMEKFRTYWWD